MAVFVTAHIVVSRSSQDIAKQATVELCDRNLYDIPRQGQGRTIVQNGPLDSRMGTSKEGRCTTCGEDLMKCIGHFGKIRLALPAFHIGYLKFTIEILQCICKVRPHARDGI